MASYNISINGVQADTPEQAQQIANALTKIKNHLTNQQIIELSDLLEKHPGIVEKAKQYKHFLK